MTKLNLTIVSIFFLSGLASAANASPGSVTCYLTSYLAGNESQISRGVLGGDAYTSLEIVQGNNGATAEFFRLSDGGLGIRVELNDLYYAEIAVERGKELPPKLYLGIGDRKISAHCVHGARY